MIQFFMAMEPPTVTFQDRRIVAVKGKRTGFYDSPELAQARAKLRAHLAQFRPPEPVKGPVRLVTKWIFYSDKHPDGAWKTTKPDVDNPGKMLKDIMTELGFWKDDVIVASENNDKLWSRIPGIYVRIEELD